MTKHVGTLVLASLLFVALAPRAHAQDVGFGAHPRPTSFARVTARWDNYLFTGNHSTDLGAGTSDVGGTLWASSLSASADFGAFVVNLSIPMAFTHTWFSTHGVPLIADTQTFSDQAELGNIELEGFADIDIGPEHRLLVGGGLALPTATDQYNLAGAGGGTTQTRGFFTRQAAWHAAFRNPAAWADQSFTLWAAASWRWATDWLLVHATGSIPFFLPTHGDYGGAVIGPVVFAPGERTIARGNVEVMFQVDAGAALRLGNLVDIGASFLGWALPSAAGVMGNPDLGQTAIALQIQTDDALDFPLGAGFEWILDLDDAWGPSGTDQRFWGAHAYITGTFDVGQSGSFSTADFHPDDVEPVHIGPSGSGGGGGASEGASGEGTSEGATSEGATDTTTTP